MELPLFPLHTVLCPGIAIPLHIFEPRYRAMIATSLDAGSPFGVVLIRQGREVGAGSVAFAGIGTLAEIREANRHPDGRYDILVVGSRRFAVERVRPGPEPYLVAEVTVLDDEVRDEARARRLATTASRRFVRYLELLQPRPGETAEEIDVRVEVETVDPAPEVDPLPGGDDPDRPGESGEPGDAAGAAAGPAEADAAGGRRVMIPDDPTVLSYLLTGIIQVELPRRQALLEATTTDERLRALLSLIDRELLLLGHRLRSFAPDPRISGARRS